MSSQAPQTAVEPDEDRPVKRSSKREPSKGNRPPRKRTKTGCLTCRKRRIKCGEERPTCFNCHKSRRECEGYRPPIVFRRSQINSSQPELSPATHLGYNGMYYPGYASQYTSPTQDDPNISSLATGWSSTGATSEHRPSMDPMFFDSLRPHVPHINTELTTFNNPFSSPETAGHTGTTYTGGSHWQLPVSRGDIPYVTQGQSNGTNVQGLGLTATGEDLLSFLGEGSGTSGLSNHASYRDPGQSSYSVSQMTGSRTQPFPIAADGNQDVVSSFPPFPYGAGARGQSEASHLATSAAPIPLNDPSNQARSNFNSHPLAPGHSFYPFGPSHASRSPFGNHDTSQMLDAAAVLTQDDDYWDLPSDEEEGDPVEDKDLFETQSLERDFDTITALTKSSLALAISNLTGATVYTYPGFSLDEYRPEHTANPLRNPYTQRVFAHFVFSTGPLISYLQQRQRVAPSSTANIGKITSSHQGLWTYTLATMALHNQGLLHAMLAMASLHMAKLQGASTTPSLKHYSYALRRIHRDVQHDRKRHEVSTLAATLLLAFFEIGQADHRKWSTHLVGAKQLISEIDFAKTMAQIKYLKAIRSMESEKLDPSSAKQQSQGATDPSTSEPREATVEELFPELDTRLVHKIMGKKCTSDGHGNLVEEFPPYSFSETLTVAELRNYQILQDLFWWNCRHDIIHGLVGGNALLYDYEKWRHCPPRAPVGQPDAVHGSFDHFILLMGRLVKFISDDRARKLRANNAASQGNSSRQAPPAQGPGFYGMAPSYGIAPLPRAYERGNVHQHGAKSSSNAAREETAANIELRAATAMALDEWNDIYTAFTALADALGPAFQPLTDEEHPPIQTPFGAAVIFKSHAIAALWAWYYAGLIIAIRSHPTMPAAQTLACGVAAHKTEKYANMVGRITYNITSDFLTPPLDPSSAGAFAESSLPIFFAAVQYQDAAQRHWTIGRLREIENLTGWASIGLCANGCESAWIKSYEMGVGPEYVKKVGIYRGEGAVSVLEEQQEQLVQDAMESSGRTHASKEEGEAYSSRSGKGSDQKEASSTQKAEENLLEHERRFTPFYRGTQVMWAYQLYSATLKDDFDGKFGPISEFMVR